MVTGRGAWYKEEAFPAGTPMHDGAEAPDTILVVDDEPAVRRTLREWLEGEDLGCRVLTAADAEEALREANRTPIDLAVLDWNLGAGADGLRLLEDLFVFNPDVVAIMVTGYAQEATPLDAMRMGVRDYFDKNAEFGRDRFLTSVRKQLDRLRPVKRERRLRAGLERFREAVEAALPLVRSAATLTDPVPLPEAVRAVVRFLIRVTDAADGVLVARRYSADAEVPEDYRAYDASGRALPGDLVPFERSLAASAASIQEPAAAVRLDEAEGVLLQPFERGRRNTLVVPMTAGAGMHLIIELFDKAGGESFTARDREIAAAAAGVGAELLRQALADSRSHLLLANAVEGALAAGESVRRELGPATAGERMAPASPPEVLAGVERALARSPDGPAFGETIQLAEAIRLLGVRHGPAALRHCARLVEEVGRLLDETTPAEPPG